MDLHPIQLRFVAVRELHINSFFPPSTASYTAAAGNLETTSSPFDNATHLLQTGIIYQSGRMTEPSVEEIDAMRASQEQPFRIRVHLVAEFKVDVAKFSVEQLPSWAKVNAPMILFPFLREQVYALTARCGYNPIILPMIHVPTIRLEQVEKQTPPSEISEERAFVQL